MIDEFKLTTGPSNIYYIPNFITCQEEEHLLKYVYNVPKPKWTQLSHRRLQNWGGVPHPNGMISEKIPDWLQMYMDNITKLGVFGSKKPNHVLINEYKPREGIMPHLDGPLFYPTITTISLGSHTILDFYTNDVDRETAFSLSVQPRSLLVLQEEAYHNYMHGIQEKDEDIINEHVINQSQSNVKSGQCIKRGTRISLTIRHVPKTTKLKISLGR